MTARRESLLASLTTLVALGCASNAQRPTISLASVGFEARAEEFALTEVAQTPSENPVQTPIDVPRAPVTEEEIQRRLAEQRKGGVELPLRLAVIELAAGHSNQVHAASVPGFEMDSLKKAVGLEGGPFVSIETVPAPFLPVSTDLASLRYVAARFGADGLLVFVRGTNQYDYANGWAALYPTVVGLAFAPGQTLEVWTAAESALVDVATGRPLAVLDAEARIDCKILTFSDFSTASRELEDEARRRLFEDLGADLKERATELRVTLAAAHPR